MSGGAGWGYLAGELAGEAVLPLPSFSRALTSCTLPPVASHSTLSSSTRRFWWHVLASSLKVNAGDGHRQRGPKKPSCLAPGGAQSPARRGRGSAGGHGGAGAPRGARCPHQAPTSRLQSDRLRELARHGLVARPHTEIHVLHVKLQPCGHGGVTNGARRGVTPRPHPQHHHPNLWASPSSHPKMPSGLDPAPCPHRPGCTRCP